MTTPVAEDDVVERLRKLADHAASHWTPEPPRTSWDDDDDNASAMRDAIALIEQQRKTIEELERRQTTLQRLYDSEINFKILTFWDSGFKWFLGDDVNGFIEFGEAKTFNDAVTLLLVSALHHYPNSGFTTDIDAPRPSPRR